MPNYLYNGVELPALPDTHQHNSSGYAFDYVLIFKNLLKNEIKAAFLEKPLYKYYRASPFNDDCIRTLPLEETYRTYTYTLNESNEWEDDGSFSNPYLNYADVPFLAGLGTYYEIIWANHDIVDNDNGSIYLAASEPVPVGVLTLTASDLYKKVNGQLVKHTLYKKVGGKLVKYDEYAMSKGEKTNE